jgi:tetratricopeptide (TPR) repeat protein
VPAQAAEPHWIRISSSHFSAVTDADEKKGHEVIVRFEQMRSAFAQLLMRSRINMSEPMDIIALQSDEEYSKVVPNRQGPAIADAFFVPGEDRNYFVLNLSKEESWHAISREFVDVLLNFNYPPTQAWFDEGFADYFSSLRLDNKQGQIGGDPASFIEMLSTPAWPSITELFTTRREVHSGQEGPRHTLFHAQSWIVMHYLLNQNKLSETGMYFELVQNQQIPVEEAIQKAYGMTSVQFGQAVKDYFHSLAPPSQALEKGRQTGNAGGNQALTMTPADEIGSSTEQIPVEEGQALVAEMSIRLPEHREQAGQELESIAGQPKTDNVIARRGLAWAHMEKRELDSAVEELSKGAEFNIKDPWLHYYLALVKSHVARSTGHSTEGLPNMMQDLRLVLDWAPEFAEARNMLAMAQLEGGGVHAALDSMQAAIRLSPRNQSYLLNMSQIYLAGKNWDAASALLEHLESSSDLQVAKTAREQLEGLPMLKKYGVPPRSATKPESQQTASSSLPSASSSTSSSSTPSSSKSGKPAEPPSNKENQKTQSDTAASEDRPDQPPAQPQPDKRPIQYLKGKLMAVDCSQPPSAILTVSAGTRVLKLRTENYKSLMLIGADEFSCEWTSRPVEVNYKPGGKTDGDLVSVEVQ